jgi:hypothetical protein
MPLDTRIPLMAAQPRRNSLTDGYVQAQQVQAGQQQMNLQQMQMDAAASAAARDTETRNALRGAVGPDGSLDYDAMERAYIGVGDAEGAFKVRGQKVKEGEIRNKAATAEIELGMRRMELEGRLLSGVRDPQSYEMARQQAAAQGLDVSDWPAEFDAGLVDQAVRATMDPKARYDIAAREAQARATQANADRTYGLGVERNSIARMRAQNSGPLATITGPDGSTIMVGGPNGIGPQGMLDAAAGRGAIKQSEESGKAVGKYFGEQYGKYQEAGKLARAEEANLSRLDSLLDNVETGAFKGTTTQLKKAAMAAGIDLSAAGIADDVAPVEAALALSNEMALQLRNPAGGAGMPGAMSDADRVFLGSMVPGIETTREGRKLQIYTRRKLNERRIVEAKEANAYYSKYGRLDPKFDQQMQEYADANPIFKPVQGEQDYAKLNKGEWYLHPDGDMRQKQ